MCRHLPHDGTVVLRRCSDVTVLFRRGPCRPTLTSASPRRLVWIMVGPSAWPISPRSVHCGRPCGSLPVGPLPGQSPTNEPGKAGTSSSDNHLKQGRVSSASRVSGILTNGPSTGSAHRPVGVSDRDDAGPVPDATDPLGHNRPDRRIRPPATHCHVENRTPESVARSPLGRS